MVLFFVLLLALLLTAQGQHVPPADPDGGDDIAHTTHTSTCCCEVPYDTPAFLAYPLNQAIVTRGYRETPADIEFSFIHPRALELWSPEECFFEWVDFYLGSHGDELSVVEKLDPTSESGGNWSHVHPVFMGKWNWKVAFQVTTGEQYQCWDHGDNEYGEWVEIGDCHYIGSPETPVEWFRNMLFGGWNSEWLCAGVHTLEPCACPEPPTFSFCVFPCCDDITGWLVREYDNVTYQDNINITSVFMHDVMVSLTCPLLEVVNLGWYCTTVYGDGLPPSDTFSFCVEERPSDFMLLEPYGEIDTGEEECIEMHLTWQEPDWGNPYICDGSEPQYYVEFDGKHLLFNLSECLRENGTVTCHFDKQLYCPGVYNWTVTAILRTVPTSEETPAINGYFFVNLTHCYDVPPPAADLLYPLGNTFIDDSPATEAEVVFSWVGAGVGEPCGNPVTFLLEYDGGGGFNLLGEYPYNDSSPTSDIFLFGPGDYDWRVTVDNGDTATTSISESFHVCIRCPPSNPSLVFLPDLYTEVTWDLPLDICFTWEHSDWGESCSSFDLDHFWFFFDSEPEIDTTILEQDISVGNGSHSWFVLADNGYANSSSLLRTFSICQTTLSEMPFVVGNLPVNGSYYGWQVPSDVTCKWDPAVWGFHCGEGTGLRQYFWKSSTNPDSLDVCCAGWDSVDASTTSKIQAFGEGEHYWRVIPNNGYEDIEPTQWPLQFFEVCIKQDPVGPTLLAPPDPSNNLIGDVVFNWTALTVPNYGKTCTSNLTDYLVLHIERAEPEFDDELFIFVEPYSSFYVYNASLDDGSYFWYLEAFNADGNPKLSDTWFFSYGNLTECVDLPPGVPTLSVPSNGSQLLGQNGTTQATLEWIGGGFGVVCDPDLSPKQYYVVARDHPFDIEDLLALSSLPLPSSSDRDSSSSLSAFSSSVEPWVFPLSTICETFPDSQCLVNVSDGEYFWTVVAWNGQSWTAANGLFFFQVCTPVAPVLALQEYDGEIFGLLPANLTWQVTWGEHCGLVRTMRLTIDGLPRSNYPMPSNKTSGSDWFFEVVELAVPFVLHNWTVEVWQGASYDIERDFFYVCELSAPTQPTLQVPPEDNVYEVFLWTDVQSVTFSWQLSDWGEECDDTPQRSYAFHMETIAMPQNWTLPPPPVNLVLAFSSVTLDVPIGLFLWHVTARNEKINSTQSESRQFSVVALHVPGVGSDSSLFTSGISVSKSGMAIPSDSLSSFWWSIQLPSSVDISSSLDMNDWTCNPDYYDGMDGCDCECGMWDPDCDVEGMELYGCGDPPEDWEFCDRESFMCAGQPPSVSSVEGLPSSDTHVTSSTSGLRSSPRSSPRSTIRSSDSIVESIVESSWGLPTLSSYEYIPISGCRTRRPTRFEGSSPINNTQFTVYGSGVRVTLEWEDTSFGENCYAGSRGRYQIRIKQNNVQHTNEELSSTILFYIIEDAGVGTWEWSVVKDNYVEQISTAWYTFLVCKDTPPLAPVLISPADQVDPSEFLPSSSLTLHWSHSDFGHICSGSYENTYTLYLSKSPVPSFSRITASSNASMTLVEDDWYWRVLASNGKLDSPFSETRHIRICIPRSPLAPSFLFPRQGMYNVPTNFSFETYPVSYEGRICNILAEATLYEVFVGESEENMTVITSLDGNHVDGVGILQFDPVVLPSGDYYAQVRFVNRGGDSSFCGVIFFTTCDLELLVAPSLLSPASNSLDISTYEIVFEWNPLATGDFGRVCIPNAIQANSLTIWLDVVSPPRDTPNTTFDSLFSASEFLVAESPLKTNTTYYWMVSSTNGYQIAYSEVWNFTTRIQDCYDDNALYCDPAGGVCVQENNPVSCRCFSEDIEGLDCSVIPPDGFPVGLYIGVGIGALACVCAASGFLIIALTARRRLRRKRVQLLPPEFEVLRFAEVKIPSRKGDEVVDTSRTEQILLADTPFETLDSILYANITDAENIAKALTYFYERHDLGNEMLCHLISNEVDNADTSETLFRANSLATKVFKFYSRMVGLPYLFSTLAVVLQSILQSVVDKEEETKEKEHAMKQRIRSDLLFDEGVTLNPEDVTEDQDSQLNTMALEKFLVQITRSAKMCPSQLGRICSHIKSVLQQKYPNFTYPGICAFMFLRFYNSAISVPEAYGLLRDPPEGETRRRLILVSKVLQSLANEVPFGTKEAFMLPFNEFVDLNKNEMHSFVDRLCSLPEKSSWESVEIPEDTYIRCLFVLQTQLDTVRSREGNLMVEI